jgi:hypothetical protein
LHKNRPRSFFANKPLYRLDKTVQLKSSKAYPTCYKADQAQYKNPHISYITDPLRGRIDALFFPATLQVTDQGLGAEVAPSLPSVASGSPEIDADMWL